MDMHATNAVISADLTEEWSSTARKTIDGRTYKPKVVEKGEASNPPTRSGLGQ
jgi:hypothetical protein